MRDLLIITSGEQRSHQRYPKKCRFNGCSKGARGVKSQVATKALRAEQHIAKLMEEGNGVKS
nr:unnamed protein product [Digitaria exilis]CAB3488429.1 unnamed protein product [Digitaria exilis]